MNSLVLAGIDGSNPLGFLAALGAARIADLTWPQHGIALRWVRDGAWRPEVSDVPVAPQDFCAALAASPKWAPLRDFAELGNNLTVEQGTFKKVVPPPAALTQESRATADFACAFGSDLFEQPGKNRIQYTDLCFITGSGHQHFLGTAAALAQSVREQHLAEALFGPWRSADESLSFRWDPADSKEYALRWDDPSKYKVVTLWGANRLAFEALPFFPVVPTLQGARTTGFRTRGKIHEFTWPIWNEPATVDTIRSLVSLKELQEEDVDRRALTARGITDVFRSRRVRIGQGANFKVSFRPARAV